MAGERIAQMIKAARGNEQDFSDVLFGQVTQNKPLIIRVDNRFEVTEQHLVLSRNVQPYSVKVEVPTIASSSTGFVQPPVLAGKIDVNSDVSYQNVVTDVTVGSRLINIQIFRALEVGDYVSLIRSQKGQLYYVLDRR
ncbi:Protein of unknown function [Amphibacillus marinus]|uniref:DUF2577 domain-containing protein n=1 Tax=Amphibacillus marinus TaxID=872970 RepID=A0A1H8IYQ0_9BACI|nr:DUF2577 domain-containing protein [Amphibacillus marinus]SEN73479.1 Protein of unknown function [Amphibacillus marinus]